MNSRTGRPFPLRGHLQAARETALRSWAAVALGLALVSSAFPALAQQVANQSPPGEASAAGLVRGRYTLNEFAPPNQTWVWTLTVQDPSAASPGLGTLSVDGFQTELTIDTTKEVHADGSVDVVFDRYDPAQAGPQIPDLTLKRGDVLFTLYPVKNGFRVAWSKVQPMLDRDAEGSVFAPPG